MATPARMAQPATSRRRTTATATAGRMSCARPNVVSEYAADSEYGMPDPRVEKPASSRSGTSGTPARHSPSTTTGRDTRATARRRRSHTRERGAARPVRAGAVAALPVAPTLPAAPTLPGDPALPAAPRASAAPAFAAPPGAPTIPVAPSGPAEPSVP